ncbi:hypothetical protein PM082_011295 [Marasmius tenuissimus]|nr:hypothetical protein PM082_011295 [Marasmius tenuissimus]
MKARPFFSFTDTIYRLILHPSPSPISLSFFVHNFGCTYAYPRFGWSMALIRGAMFWTSVLHQLPTLWALSFPPPTFRDYGRAKAFLQPRRVPVLGETKAVREGLLSFMHTTIRQEVGRHE